VTAAQVRRDLMTISFTGSPAKGYEVEKLHGAVSDILGPAGSESIALVGVGHLGRALLAYFLGRRPEIVVGSAFDVDPDVVGTEIAGCVVRPIEEIETVLAEHPALVGVLAVPRGQAQTLTDRLIACGVTGILNFCPVRIQVPAGIHVEDVDIATSAEKALFFARYHAAKREGTA
jgi:redox-sensing transcriptional repressor